MGDGGIAQQQRYLGNTEALFVQQELGMFHTLALVELKDGGAEQLLEAFFQVAFVDGHPAAQVLYGDGLANLLDQDLPGLHDLFAVPA